MAYLEERYPEPPLLPADLAERARARLLVHRFDDNLGDDYYAFRRGDDNDLAERLDELEVGQSLYADVAYVPWVIRARDMLGVELPRRIAGWLDGARAAAVDRRGGRARAEPYDRDRDRGARGAAGRGCDRRRPHGAGIRRHARPAVRPAPGAHPRRAECRRLRVDAARAESDRGGTRRSRRAARSSRTATAAHARRSRRRCCGRWATTPATSSVRGTSGRATTTCRSSASSRLRETHGTAAGRAPARRPASRRARLRGPRAASAASGRRGTIRAAGRGAPPDGTARPTPTPSTRKACGTGPRTSSTAPAGSSKR